MLRYREMGPTQHLLGHAHYNFLSMTLVT
jgi:hypothetical protein